MKFRGQISLELAARAAVFEIVLKSHGQNQSKELLKRVEKKAQLDYETANKTKPENAARSRRDKEMSFYLCL